MVLGTGHYQERLQENRTVLGTQLRMVCTKVCLQTFVHTILKLDNDTQVLPVTIQKDGMGLKPGIQVDSTKVKIIGTTHNIDYKYIKETPTLGNLKTYLLLKLNAIVQHHLMESDPPSWCRLYSTETRW